MLGLFPRCRTAPVARARLKTLLACERAASGHADLVAVLRREVLAVVARHLPVGPERVRVRTSGRPLVSRLRVDIELPDQKAAARAGRHC